ncbi:MAG: transcriptional regulator [Bacteroidetes bacterium]|nr:transcriptional regulator [Bacteroidota bacterium]
MHVAVADEVGLRDRLIQSWGSLGSQWGINRTMAQIHALLLIAPEALSTDEIMAQLQVSRGNVNMNLRELMNWQLVRKEVKTGERMEFFVAEKDMWKVFRLIFKERKKRELDPMMEVIHELKGLKGDHKNKEFAAFSEVMEDLDGLTNKGEKMMELIIKSDENWFVNTFIKLMR